MSDIVDNGPAPAAPDSTSAPETQEQVSPPNPIKTEPQPAEPKPEPEEKPKLSARDAIKQAKEKLEAKEKEADKAKPVETEAKEKGKEQTDKAEDKTEKAVPKEEAEKPEAKDKKDEATEKAKEARTEQKDNKDDQPRFDPPKRFSSDAQKEWDTVPTSVKAEVHRAIRENEEGINKYKASHERYEQFKDYDETAKQNGRDLKESIGKIVEFEKVMQQNPLAAVNYALKEAGPRKPDGSPLTVDDIVSHVHGQSDDQRLQQAHSQVSQLRQENEKLKAHIQQTEAAAKIPDVVAEFAADPANDRFDELSDAIITLLETEVAPGIPLAPDLQTAYKLAAAFSKPETNGAHTTKPQEGAHTADTPDDDTEAQTLKAQAAAAEKAAQSVKGAPGSGSNPAKKPQSATVRESLHRALRQAG